MFSIYIVLVITVITNNRVSWNASSRRPLWPPQWSSGRLNGPCGRLNGRLNGPCGRSINLICSVIIFISNKKCNLCNGCYHLLLTLERLERDDPCGLLELEVNGDSRITNERDPSLVGSCQYKRFLFCLCCSSRPRTKYFFLHRPYTISVPLSPSPSKLDRQAGHLSLSMCLWL
jgi:hypothetical protein